MEFICPRCEESFKRKDYLIAHLNRKNECSTTASKEARQSIIDKLTTKQYNEKTYDCDYCNKKFNKSCNKYRHKKTCKKNPINIKPQSTDGASTSQHVDTEDSEDDSDYDTPSKTFMDIDDYELLKRELREELKNELTDSLKKDFKEEFMKELKDTFKNEIMQELVASTRTTNITDVSIASTSQDNTTVVKKKRRNIPNSRRISTWNKHIGIDIGRAKCMCCQKRQITQHKFICGHVISDKDGGSIEVSNLRPICFTCNEDMHDENMRDFAKRMYNVVFE